MSALVLIPLLLLAVIYLPTVYFAIAVALVILLATWEMANMLKLDIISQWVFYSVILVALFGAYYIPALWLMTIAMVWWLVALGLVLTYSQTRAWWHHKPVILLTMTLLILVPAWRAAVELQSSVQYTTSLLIFLMVLIWLADSVAYFAGRAWGKTKLAPHVSPGKTQAGLVAALGVTSIFAFVTAWLTGNNVTDCLLFTAICLVTTIASVVGDLTESMLKRAVGAKDSSQLIPGHGGVFDRIDSLTAAAPVFLFFIILAGKT